MEIEYLNENNRNLILTVNKMIDVLKEQQNKIRGLEGKMAELEKKVGETHSSKREFFLSKNISIVE